MLSESLLSFITIRWLDVIDIILVAVLMYQLYKLVKGTVAIRIFIGILSIYLIWKIVESLQMDLLSEILGQFIGVGVIALIIVFQQELRRFLLLIGTTGFFTGKRSSKWFSIFKWKRQKASDLNIDAIVMACKKMAKTYTGALIVIARESDLKYYSSTGEKIDAELSTSLLESIFFKNSPLHDGGVIIAKNRITAARCVLPVSESDRFPTHLGLRHRAGAGITENTGALSIIVSEETGKISFCSDGKIKDVSDEKELREQLLKELD